MVSQAALTGWITRWAFSYASQLLGCKSKRPRKIRLRASISVPEGEIVRADKSVLFAMVAVCCAVASAAWSQNTADCSRLSGLSLPDTTALTAEVVAASQFTPPSPPPALPPEDAQE